MKKLGRIIFIGVAITLILSAYGNYRKLKSARMTIEEARVHTESLEKEEELLEKQLSETEQSQFIEKQLRDKLGMAKEGEIVVVLPDPQEVKKLAPAKSREEEYIPQNNWQKWKELFF